VFGSSKFVFQEEGGGNGLLERIDARRMVSQNLIGLYGIYIWWLKKRAYLAALRKPGQPAETYGWGWDSKEIRQKA